jgi:hypothetical protein
MMIDKSLMVISNGGLITQSLFLEHGYTDMAIYTWKDYDHTYNGKVYPSLKRLYLEMEDPVEYEFANTYLMGWNHWQRLLENKVIRKHIDEWREELEFKLRSKGVRTMLNAANGGNYQASKFFIDRGWDTRKAGRPSKAEVAEEKAFQSRITSEYGDDVVRLFQNKG